MVKVVVVVAVVVVANKVRWWWGHRGLALLVRVLWVVVAVQMSPDDPTNISS